MKIIKSTFKNIGEVVEMASRPASKAFKKYVTSENSRTSRSDETYFHGTNTFEEAVKLINSGWAEGADKITALSAKLNIGKTMDIDQIDLTMDTNGALLDIPEYITGNPDCFYNFIEAPADTPVIKVGFQINGLASMRGEAFNNRGLAMLALVDALEFSGHAVELYAFEYSTGREGYALQSEVLIKRPDEPLDKDKLAFVGAHPSFFRRIFFGVREATENEDLQKYIIADSYGHSRTIPDDAHDYDICPTYDEKAFKTPESAMWWVRDIAKEAGVSLE